MTKLLLMDMDNTLEFSCASSVDEAFQKLNAEKYDVIISDYEMPKKNGLEFLKELRGKNGKIPFILFTGKGREEIAIKALNLGADGYYNKQGAPETVFGELLHGIKQNVKRSKAAEKLKETQNQLEATIFNAPIGIATSDANMHFLSANEVFCEILGYSEKELQKLTFKEITHQDDIESSRKNMSDLNSGKIHYFSQEKRYVRKDGTIIDGRVMVSVVWEEEGKPKLYVVELENITERKKSETELRTTLEILERIGESIDSGLAVINRDYHVVWANKRLMNLGVSPNKKCYQTFNQLDTICPDCGVKKIFEQNILFDTHEYKTKEANGKAVWIELRVTPLKDKSGIVTAALELAVPITQRKEIEEELIKREKRFRNFADSLPEIVFETDIQGKLTYANEKAFETTGYTTEDLAQGLTAFDFIDQEGKKRAREHFKKTIMNEPSPDNEYTFVKKDGTTFPIIISSKPIVEQNRVIGLRGIVVDISKRKQVEEVIKRSEARYRELANSLPEIVFETDLTGKITFFSQQALEVTGFTKEEFEKGINLLSFVVPRHRNKATENIQKTLDKIEHRPSEYTLFRKNGTTYPAIVKTVPIISNNKVIGIRGIALDITDRKKSEKQLHESEEKFRAITRSVKDAIILIDNESKVVYWNPAAENIFGYSHMEIKGKVIHDLVVPKTMCKEGKDTIAAGIQKFAKTGQGAFTNGNVELQGLKKDGTEFSAKLSLTPIKLQDKWHAVGVVKDITERRNAEQQRRILERRITEYSEHLKYLVDLRTIQLREANERLVRSERLAAIGELAGMVGHDLRNPLSSIKNAAYFLKKKGTAISEDQYREMLESIDIAICRSDKIINDLLDYAREMTVELAEHNVHTIVNEAIGMVNIPDRIQITNNVNEKILAWVNKDKILRVFINLIKNALDAIPQRGSLFISSHKTRNKLEITFADTGTGIPDDILPKLFTPLFTTKAQGMGFGLAICKRIVEAHGGDITVKTSADEGTTFTITLPLNPKTKKECDCRGA